MKKKVSLAVGLVAFTTVASGAITISEPPSGYIVTNDEGTGAGRQITIHRTTSSGGMLDINATTSTDKIDFIRVTADSTAYTSVFHLRVGTVTAFPIESIGSITVEDNAAVHLTGPEVSGDVGEILGAQGIALMDIQGDVTGDIFVPRNSQNGGGGSISSSSVVRGDVIGSVTVGLNVVDFTIRGTFGHASAARTMRAYGDIQKLVIGEVLENATIEARDGSDTLMSIQNLTIDDQWGASGDMDGEIIADAVEVVTTGDSLLQIYGDLNGTINLASPFESRMLISGSFGADAEIILPEDGLVGQISFNTAGGSATWAGDLLIDSLTYSEEYAADPADIGGGAAGLAPFTTHDEVCEPENGESIFITGMDPLDPEFNCEDIADIYEIEIRLYGPVSLTGDPDTALDVMVKNPSTGTFSQVSFAIDIEIDSTLAEAGRLIRISRDDAGEWPLGQYKILPKAGRVPCTDVAGPTNANFTYEFWLLDGCELMLLSTYDLNSDDTLCPADIACWTANPVDLNNDSNADGDDVTLLINAVNAYNN